MTTCPACRHEATELHDHRSVLDFQTRGLCWDCIECNAEPQAVVIASLTKGWDLVPIEIRRSITVFDVDAYVSPAEWSKRARARRDGADAADRAITEQAREFAKRIHGDALAPTNRSRFRFPAFLRLVGATA